MRLYKVVLVSAVFLLMAMPVRAAFEESLFLNVRASGMGGALVAVGNDIGSALVNPAGMSFMQDPGIYVFGGALYPGLVNDSITQNCVVVGYPQVLLSKFGKYIVSSPAVAVSYSGLTSAYYSETLTAVSLGGRFIQDSLRIGVNIKMLNTNPIGITYLGQTEDFEKNEMGYDIGLLFELNSNTKLGIVAYNFNQPDLGTKVPDYLYTKVKVGLGYGTEDFVWGFDWLLSDAQFNFGMGFEQWLLKHSIALRAGIKDIGKDQLNVSCGFGYRGGKSMPYQLDYAFVMPVTLSASGGIHRVALSLGFGNTQAKIDAERKSKDTKGPVQIKDLTVAQVDDTTIKLEWSAPIDIENEVEGYLIRYATSDPRNILDDKGITGGQTLVSTTTAETMSYLLVVDDNMSTAWAAAGKCPQSLYLLFPGKKEKVFNKINLVFSKGVVDILKTFELQALNAPDADPAVDESWVSITQTAKGLGVVTKGDIIEYSMPPVKSAGLRLYITEVSTGVIPAVCEIEVYNNEFDWNTAMDISGELMPLPEKPGTKQICTIPDLTPKEYYNFAILSSDPKGNQSPLSNIVSIQLKTATQQQQQGGKK